MQICPHCGTENLEGMLYCQKCGVALGPVPLSTRQLTEDDVHGGTDQLGADNVVILQVENDETPILVQVRSEVVFGRVTEQSDTTTYINLTPYGADDLGVSRRHARLLRDGKAVYLMDLNSTNGTQLNGESLPTSVEKRLRDGDEILLGRMRVFIYFKT
ncbi:MAG: FHA domain-containing protein [Anaerolineae bacterium]|nr:FHA domain-containing protein [Anaerolineae bacterium]